MAEKLRNAATMLQCNCLATLPPQRAAELQPVDGMRWFRSDRIAQTMFSGRTLLATWSTAALPAPAPLDQQLECLRADASADAGADEDEADLPAVDELCRSYRLTEREAEVTLLLAQRHTSKEIARVLGISWHTARRHTERVLGKLGVHSRRQVLFAIRHRPACAGTASFTRAHQGHSHSNKPMPYAAHWSF